ALGLRRRLGELVDGAVELAGVSPVSRDRTERLARVAGRPFEELRHDGVPPGALRARNQLVRDVADQDMREPELRLVLENRRRLATDEIPPLERIEQLFEIVDLRVECAQRVEPE